MTPKNYDSVTGLYWFRKVEHHPNGDVYPLALAFGQRASSWVDIESPRVFWFEDADAGQASQAWLENPSRKDQALDPLREPCQFFRWRGKPGMQFWGYAHRESPLGIMINVCLSGEDLLRTIAEECFHIHQDTLHGAGWRDDAGWDAVEGEAKEFVSSKGDEIRDFLCAWVRPEGSS